MSIVIFLGVTIFIFSLLVLIAGVIFLERDGLRIMAGISIFVLLASVGVAYFSYQTLNDYREQEKVAQAERAIRIGMEEMERQQRLAIEEAERKAEEETAKREEEAKKAAEKKTNGSGKEKKPDKKAERNVDWNAARKLKERRELGRALAEVESGLGREVVEIDNQMKQASLLYEQGKISSYEELKRRATLGLKRQELILKALKDKEEMLKATLLVSDEEKMQDWELLDKRRAKALEDKEKYEGMLRQVEENSDVFKKL